MTSAVARQAPETTLSEADIHDVLRNDRRRLVLERLAESDTRQSVSDLAEHIASIESGEDPPPRNIRQSVYVSLHQTHLPKLDELGIVSYDANAKSVTSAENADDVAVYMEVVPDEAISWGEYYLGMGLLGLVTLCGHLVGVPVLRDVSGPLLAAGLFLAITVSAGYHVLTQQESLPWDRADE